MPLDTPARGSLRDDLRIPAVSHRRFLTVVLPVAPWVFGAAAYASRELTIATAAFAALALGAGYGLAMVSGLLEIQRITGPRDLAGLTAVFYSVTYLGASPHRPSWRRSPHLQASATR